MSDGSGPLMLHGGRFSSDGYPRTRHRQSPHYLLPAHFEPIDVIALIFHGKPVIKEQRDWVCRSLACAEMFRLNLQSCQRLKKIMKTFKLPLGVCVRVSVCVCLC